MGISHASGNFLWVRQYIFSDIFFGYVFNVALVRNRIIWVVFVVLITLYTLNEADGDHHCLVSLRIATAFLAELSLRD